MTGFSPERFRQYAEDLSAAVYNISTAQIMDDQPMSLTGYQPGAIKAAIDRAKQDSQAKVAEAMAKLAAAHTKAAEEVPEAIKLFAAKIDKEASDALQELAQYDNGAPVLDNVTDLPKVDLSLRRDRP